MNDQELLKYMQDNNIIDMAYVQEQIEMKKRKDILNKHPYRVWLAQDGYWKTYFPKADGTKQRKHGRLSDEYETNFRCSLL